MQVDISAIITSRNRLWSLPKAIESCRSATLNVQIIIVDDASDDGTSEWLLKQKDIEVIQGNGWGKPWGVNSAMQQARGTFVRYLDSDDWLNPGANEIQLQIAKEREADVVVAGCDIYDGEDLSERQDWIETDDFIAQQLGETRGSHYSAFLFRREFVQAIPHRTLFPASDFASRDDRCFVLEAALRDPVIAVCPSRTLCHRRHNLGRLQSQIGLRRDGTVIQQLYVYKQILRLLSERGQLTSRRKKVVAKILWPLAHWIAFSHIDDGCTVAQMVEELDHEFVPPEKGWLGRSFRTLGFRQTEQILRVRRALLFILKH